MRDDPSTRRRRSRREVKGSRRNVHQQLGQMRGLRVNDALGVRPTEKPTARNTAPGETTMFKVVPSPDDPEMFVVQSDPMPRPEAEQKAKACNDMEGEEKSEGEGEKMPPFGPKPGGAMPPFGPKPGGAMPAMPPMGGL